jgi:hypothetical protein
MPHPSDTLVKVKTGQVGAHCTALPAEIGAEMDAIKPPRFS